MNSTHMKLNWEKETVQGLRSSKVKAEETNGMNQERSKDMGEQRCQSKPKAT